MPSTLVVTNSDAPSRIDFSTCDSAAAFDDHVDASHHLAHQPRVADVPVHELEPRVAHHLGEVLEIARVGERVERDHIVFAVREQVADQVRRDEPRAAGDQDTAHESSLSTR